MTTTPPYTEDNPFATFQFVTDQGALYYGSTTDYCHILVGANTRTRWEIAGGQLEITGSRAVRVTRRGTGYRGMGWRTVVIFDPRTVASRCAVTRSSRPRTGETADSARTDIRVSTGWTR